MKKEENPSFSEILQAPIDEAYEDDDFYYIRPKPEMFFDLTMWKVDKRTKAVKPILYTEFFSVESRTREINPSFLKKTDYLAHHGKRGQRWGIQNGPPYPLYRQEKFRSKSSYKKVMAKKTGEQEKSGKERGSVVAAIAVASAAAGGSVGLAMGVANAIYRHKLKKYNEEEIAKAREKVQRIVKSTSESTKNGFRTLSKPETVDEVIKNTNPWKDTAAGRSNCYNCSFAASLRMRGYDVVASPQAIPRGDGVLKTIKNRKDCVFKITGRDMGHSEESAARYIKRTVGKQDGNGIVVVTWYRNSGGHAFNWEIKNGKVRFFDTQGGKADINFNDYFKHTAHHKTEDYIVRLDNADFDWNKLRKYRVVE